MRAGISSEKNSSSRSGMGRFRALGESTAGLGRQPCLAAGFRQLADAQDVALPLSDRDDAARVEQVERVDRLDALVVSGQRHEVAPRIARVDAAGVDVYPEGAYGHGELLEPYLG